MKFFILVLFIFSATVSFAGLNEKKAKKTNLAKLISKLARAQKACDMKLTDVKIDWKSIPKDFTKKAVYSFCSISSALVYTCEKYKEDAKASLKKIKKYRCYYYKGKEKNKNKRFELKIKGDTLNWGMTFKSTNQNDFAKKALVEAL